MQVKDYLQALQDENLIRVEKIGSGNWYWSFTSDAKRNREKEIRNLLNEHSRLLQSIEMTDRETSKEMSWRVDNDSENIAVTDGDNSMNTRMSLLETYEALQLESTILDRELEGYSENDPAEVERKIFETVRLKDSAFLWTDNILALECFLGPLVGDRTQLAEIMHAACGDEYVVGEGLHDL